MNELTDLTLIPKISDGAGDSESVMHTKFPNELLSEIFVSSTIIPITVPPPLKDEDLPWAFLRVCKKWRHVALETPSLWNNVHIDYEHVNILLQKTIAAERIIERTKGSNISLNIRASGFYGFRKYEPRVFKLILSNSARITSLILKTSDTNTFFKLEPIPFPSLEFLVIDDGHGWNLIDTTIDIPGFTPPPYEVSVWKNTPLLREFVLGTNIAWKMNMSSLSWAQLTYLFLHATKLPVEEAHNILCGCPNLVSLKITPGELGNENVAPVDQPVHLPSLKELTIEFFCSDEISIFLQPLVAPCLGSLFIWYPGYNLQLEPEWNSSLIPILASFPQLKSLVFNN